MADKTKFLSYAGLSKLWELIGGKFATKTDALKSVSMTADKNNVNVVYTKVDDKTTSTSTLPVASTTQAGIITAATFDKIEAVAGDITKAVTVKDVKIGDASILHEKVASFALEYEVNNSDPKAPTAYIALVDAGVAKGTAGRALSKIDVSALIKTGILAAVDLVVNPSEKTGTFIKMTFNTVDGTSDTYINVTDLIDVYAPGDGIDVTDGEVNGEDGEMSTRTISLKPAGDGTIGGIKLGYVAATGVKKTYAVEVDANGKAFVNVPWVDVTAGITGDSLISATGELKDGTGSFVIAATQDLKDAVRNANSAVQTAVGETGDAALVTASAASNKITVGTTDKLKNAVSKAESALQTVTDGSNLLTITTSGTTVTIADSKQLTDAVAAAETAMQSVNVLGTTLKDGDALSVDAAKTALGLGSAAYVDTVAAISEVDTLPTAKAVKTYVDKAISDVNTGSVGAAKAYTDQEIQKLDATFAAETDADSKPMFLTGLTQTDGKITAVTRAALSVNDLTDFVALTDAEIEGICK